MLISSIELQHEQPQLYESLTSNLTPDERTIVQSVVHEAEAIAAREVAESVPVPNGVA